MDVNGVKIGGKCAHRRDGRPLQRRGRGPHRSRWPSAVKAGGAYFLRGGAYKPRTSPYSFQGLGTEGIL